MSERINEMKETNGDGEISRLLEAREVGDAGRVVVVLKAMDQAVDTKRFHSYMFLLNMRGVVPTHYWFVSKPLPFSRKMENDTTYLVVADLVSRELALSPLSITDRGKKWVRETLEEDEKMILPAISEEVSAWHDLTDGELFDMAYADYIRG